MPIGRRAGAISSTATNGTTTLAATMPATAVGDIALAVCVYQSNGTAGVITPPSGWTPIPGASGHGAGTTGIQMAWAWKLAGASEPATHTWTGTNVAGRIIVAINSYTGVDPANPVSVSAFASLAASSTTRPTGSITVPAATCWVVSAFADRAASTYTGTDTERHDLPVSNTSLMYQDSNGAVAAGSTSRTATALNASSTGAQGIIALNALNNVAPTANVEYFQVVAPGSSVVLDGSASVDPDGTISSYAWDFLYPTSGNPAITNPNSQSASFTASNVEGTIYAVRLTVTDNSGATNSDVINVLVFNSAAGSNRLVRVNGSWE